MGKEIQCSFQRYEKKYLLGPDQLEKIQEGMAPYLCPDEFGVYTIGNVYYDTEDYRLIRASLEKPVYKEKLRLRAYGVPGDGDSVFVELKKKVSGVVYKRRAVLPAAEAAAYVNQGCPPERKDQICREIDWFLQSYRPAPRVYIAYDRTAFRGRENPELRVTFDTGLRWRDRALDLRDGDEGEPLLPPDRTLMELKLPGAAPLWLAHLLSEAGAFPVSFSKYGICYREKLLPERTAAGKGVLSCA